MYIQGTTLLEFVYRLEPETILSILGEDKNLIEKAGIKRILELCALDQIAGVATSARVKYLVAKVPVLSMGPRSILERAGGGCIGQDSRTVVKGDDTLALNYSHDFRVCSTYGAAARSVTANLVAFRSAKPGPNGRLPEVPHETVVAACTLGAGIC